MLQLRVLFQIVRVLAQHIFVEHVSFRVFLASKLKAQSIRPWRSKACKCSIVQFYLHLALVVAVGGGLLH